jgi:P27 family predicted phage terminase small subunit
MPPQPKPVALKVLEGNPGKRRLPRQPKLAPLTEHAPESLPAEGRAEWRRLQHEWGPIGLTTRADRAALLATCHTWATYVAACKEVTANGLTLVETHILRGKPYTRTYPNPSIKIARDALAQLIPLWARFGMTPADRARLDMPVVEEADDPFLHLLT